jgi:hypothetical protein
MGGAAARWIQRLSAARISTEALQRGQSRVIDASLTLIRERAKLKVALPSHPLFSYISPHYLPPLPRCKFRFFMHIPFRSTRSDSNSMRVTH